MGWEAVAAVRSRRRKTACLRICDPSAARRRCSPAELLGGSGRHRAARAVGRESFCADAAERRNRPAFSQRPVWRIPHREQPRRGRAGIADMEPGRAEYVQLNGRPAGWSAEKVILGDVIWLKIATDRAGGWLTAAGGVEHRSPKCHRRFEYCSAGVSAECASRLW